MASETSLGPPLLAEHAPKRCRFVRQHSLRKVLVTACNFGCGSSREHAVWALADYGFRCVIAPSYADIFFNNCFKNGVLPIVFPENQIDQLFANVAAHGQYELTIDLESQTVQDGHGLEFSFDVNEFRRHCLLNGLDDIALTLEHEAKITAFEQRMP